MTSIKLNWKFDAVNIQLIILQVRINNIVSYPVLVYNLMEGPWDI